MLKVVLAMLFGSMVVALAIDSQAMGAEVLTLNLQQAIERALKSDPRIAEKKHLEGVAVGVLKEVKGYQDIFVDTNFYIGLAPTLSGGFYEGGAREGTKPRSDNPTIDDIPGISPWFYLQGSLIKPLKTFGKIENYSAAAKSNIVVKQGETRLQRGQTILDVSRAYFGYLTARDVERLLDDAQKQLDKARQVVESGLEKGKAKIKQADLYALQTGIALIKRYRAQAVATQQVAISGLKVLTAVGLENDLKLAEDQIKPIDVPQKSLEDLTRTALQERPEIKQLNAGLSARRALVAAKKAEITPTLYAGVVGIASYTPGRDQLNNPHIYDVFNVEAFTPIVGLKWQWSRGVQKGQVMQAEAELNAIIDKSDLARAGIPFEVAEQYFEVKSYFEQMNALSQGSRAARRWMIASYTDFEAGVENPDKVMTALQAYVLAHSDYLRAVNDYNMHIVKLNYVTGAYQ